jgi:hypothetical protein
VGGLIFLEVHVIKGDMGGEAAEYMAFYDHSGSKDWDESRRSIGRARRCSAFAVDSRRAARQGPPSPHRPPTQPDAPPVTTDRGTVVIVLDPEDLRSVLRQGPPPGNYGQGPARE